MNKTVGIVLKIVLLGAIVGLAYFIIQGINEPIEFKTERQSRFDKTINRLKDIRTAQVSFKEVTGFYTPDFDSLIDFIKKEDIRVVRAIGFVPDTLTEAKALELGIISRDTFFIPIMDSLFKHIDYPIESLKYLPVGTKREFSMDTASVMTGSGVNVKVFEVRVSYWDVLDGLNEQLIINYNSEKRQRSYVDVYVNGDGVLKNISMKNGKGPINYDFEAAKGDTIIVSYTAGSWPYENAFDIIDDNDVFLLEKYSPDPKPGSAWQSDVLQKSGVYTIRLYDERGDGWYGGLSVGSVVEANNNAGNWE